MSYIVPGGTLPPQLSNADLKTLTPAEINQAEQAGQFAVIKSGREPLPFETRGERKATAEEDQQARAEAAAHAKVEATHRAQAIRNALKENKR